ncbi:protein FAM13A-like [Dendronephthya gigantea]|uniref:protein FAM13A-like n=1 Tax=Dendronephthya gigantea TaxID=151771 RepID=UPI00106ADB56|nr:protein FAM13A-like [Dendronephthya gigantea]
MKYLRSPSYSVEKFQKSESSNSSARSGIEEQMAKMKKMIRSPMSKRKHEGNTALNPPKTFGVALDELLQRNSENSEIPYVLERITEYIVCYGMKQEGIFRVNGNAKVMEKLKSDFDKDGDANLENSGDVMSVAGLMKMFLRELPEPLIPNNFMKAFMQVHKEYHSDKDECCVRMRDLAGKLPEPRRKLLKFLCRFLVHMSLHQDSNKMNANALAIVFSPNLFRCSDGIEGFREQSVTNSIVLMFIDNYNMIFKDKDEEPPSLANFIQVQEARDSSFTGPPATPIPYEQHKKLKGRRDKTSSPSNETQEMISPYAEYRLGDDNTLVIGDEPKLKIENHIYASVSKTQREAIRNSTIYDLSSEEAEPYIRSNSPCWQKPNGEASSPKMGGSSPKSRKEFMERTIKESIKEHLFGHNLTSTSEESDKLDSPSEEAPPVPPKIPELLSPDDTITRSQKRKKRRGSKSSQENAKILSNNEGPADETDGVKSSEIRYKHKSDQEPDQGVVRSPKRQHRSRQMDMEGRQPLMINVVDYDSAEGLSTKKEKSLNNDYNEPNELKDLDLSTLKTSGVLSCLTLHRAPLPRRRRPPSFRKSKPVKIDMRTADPEVKSDLKQLPRKPPSPPPRPNLSPSNSISPAMASKLERRKQVRGMPELPPKSGIERDIELDSEGGSCPSDSPTGDSPVSSINLKRSECLPIVPPLELYKLSERTEDDPMVSPRERYDGGCAFDDAMVSPRSRRGILDIRGFSSECPPSPPAKQENHFWLDKKPSTSPKGESSLKELYKRAKSFKKKIRDFEEKFEDENGYKPTQAQDKAPIKKYLSELNRTQRLIQEMKEKRIQGERTPVEVTTQSPPASKDAEPLLTTIPGTVEQSLEISLRKLKEKREANSRPENVDDMSRDQLQDEKLAVQKALLQHENTYGRPTTKRDKDIMKPLYDRYRTIKRKITNYSLKESSDSPLDLKSKSMTDKRKTSPERPTELDVTTVSQVDTLGSTASETVSRLAKSLPARTSKNLFENDMSPVSPLSISVDESGNSPIDDDPGGADDVTSGGEHALLTAKDSDAILHQASIDELLEQQASAIRRKKKLRKRLKSFEDNFAKKTGRKVQREDRGSHEGDYEEYKKIKARLRLLDALITKQQGNSTI